MANETSYLPAVVLIVVVIVGAGAGAGYLYYKTQPASAPSTLLAQIGDNATVTYIGILGSGPEQGKVFDTSVYSVASNNATWPKALQFGFRGGPSSYTQLGVHIGSIARANYTLNNYSFVQVVPGFWQGLVGIPTNITHTIVVPPALGYAAYACSLVLPLEVDVPVLSTFPGTQFQKLYPGILATTGATFTDPHYGWTVQILSANSTSVTIQNLAHVGEIAHPNAWAVQVTNVTSSANGSGVITLLNALTPNDAGHVAGTSTTGLSCAGQSATRYIVTAVNLTAGTYTEDFNQEVAGQTLIFLVKIVNLFPATVAATTAR
ncbi:MAG TPA: hypothetical protein VJQ43_03330 [Thermoplasmata archaeon]|nr:hypothetical protein [Thermoplasmata archaeon]